MMKISSLLQTPSVKILLFLHEKGEVRYADLTKLIASRGTLSLNIKELEEEELIQRRVVTTKPIQAHYSLTDKGRKIATYFDKIKKTL
jgi:DNA-binding HxlR family transcriptional regulator